MARDSYDDYFDDYKSNEYSNSFNPQPIERDTFKQRNDPEKLLHRFKLQLMNAYEVEETLKLEDGTEKIVKKIKMKTNTVPVCNKQGVEEIVSYAEKIINSHTVQGNIDSLEEYRIRMRYISADIIAHFIMKRKDWNMTLKNCDVLIGTTTSLIDIFLTRTLFNEERKGYGESYKETTHHETKAQEKPNFFQKVGGFLAGRGVK